MDRPLTQDQLHVLRQAAEAAWGDETRHPAHKGHPCRALGQCFVTAAWLQTLFGGHIAHKKDGHYFWLSQNKLYALDLTGDQFVTPPEDASLEGVKLDPDDEGVHLGTHHLTWRSGPILHQKATHPLFAGWEILQPVKSHQRAALFVRRANRVLDALQHGHKLAIDLGDAYPGEQPQYINDHGEGFMHDDPFEAPEAKHYNVIYANGELHLSADDSHDDLARHALIPPNHAGPFAAGYVSVDPMGKANWQLQSNVGLHSLMRVLKEYGKTTGWEWGGLTDATGQPINDDFAPKKSLHYAFVKDRLFLSKDPVTLRVSSLEDDALYGRIDIQGKTANVPALLDAPWTFEAIKEWADDEGLTLTAGDNVIKRIEDLQQGNLWSPTDNDPEGTQFFHEPKRDERSPGGVFKCPECARIFPSWHLYIQHRQDEEPVADSAPEANDSGMDPLPNMDDPIPANFTEMEYNNGMTAKVAVVQTAPDEWTAYMAGFPAGMATVEDGVLQNVFGSTPHVTDALLNRVQRAHDSLAFHGGDGEWESDEVRALKRLGFYRTGKTTYKWSKQPDPSKELEGAVPFIYDVDKDSITTGAPGGRHSDIMGRFTPAGIVEGLYEPGGKVIIRTVTNMPYTVRHMLELWYYQHPHLVIKSVHLRDDAGQDTKLARTANDDERCPSCGATDEYQGGLCYSCGYGSHSCPRCNFEMDHQGLLGGEEPYCPSCGYEGGRYNVPNDLTVPSGDGAGYPDARAMIEQQHPHIHDRMTDMLVNAQPRQGAIKRSAQEVGQYIANLVASDDVAYRAYQALKGEGGKVFAVGGCVRDALLGKSPKDIDLMVTGLPAEAVDGALRRLPGRVDLTGKDFGVFRYREGEKGEVEIALPRRERSTGAGHQDFDVSADHTMTPQEDFYRRDYTVNAMGVDLDSGKLIDPFGGADDIERGQFRVLNDQSLHDDPLRTVRALAIRGKHGLEPDEQTRAQMGQASAGITHLPAERIQAELDKIMASKDPEAAMRLARDSGVLKHIFPEVDAAFGYDQNNPHHEQELGEHLLSVLKHTAKLSDDPDLRLAALLHDIGKPASRWNECIHCTQTEGQKAVRPKDDTHCDICGNPLSGHYYEHRVNQPDGSTSIYGAAHEDVGADMARERLEQLKYPAKRIAHVGTLIQHHMFPGFDTEKGARRFLNRVGEHADDLLTLRQADQGGKTAYPTDEKMNVDTQRDLLAAVRAKGEATSQANLAVNGHDLINHLQVKPGPHIGEILRRLTDDVVDDPSLNEREALLQRAQGYGLA